MSGMKKNIMRIGIYLMLTVLLIFIPVTTAQDFSKLYKELSPSVVVVFAYDSDNRLISQGSGFFIDEIGDVITNLHVVQGSNKLEVVTVDGKRYHVKDVLAKNLSGDLFLASVGIPKNTVHPLKLNSSLPSIGEDIVIIGCPEGLEQTMTRGIISSVRDIGDYGTVVQIDAAISPGSSGSPVLNAKGEVIGIATFAYINGQNLNFAISSKQMFNLTEKAGIYELPVASGSFKSTDELFSKASDLYQQMDYINSLRYLDEIIKNNSTFFQAYFLAGLCNDNLGRYYKSMDYYNKSIEMKPQSVGAWHNKGEDFISLGKYEEAIKCYEKAIELDPKSNLSWGGKGTALYGLGKYDEAIRCLDKAIELNPGLMAAWNNKALALYGLKKYDEALQTCDKAIEINPKSAEAWNNKGIILDNLRKRDEAIKCYEKATELNPELADAWYNKGLAFEGLGKYDEAIQAFDKAIKLNPAKAETWRNKGLDLYRLNRYDEAIQAFDKAIEFNPRLADAWGNKGITLAIQGKYDEAIKAFDKVIEIDPSDQLAWLNRAVILEKLGRTTEAKAAKAKAKELGYKGGS